MPGAAALFPERHRLAVEKVEVFLANSVSDWRRLSGEEISRFSAYRITDAWWIGPVAGIPEVLLLVDATFPYSLPRVALVDSRKRLPHLGKDGLLCLYRADTTFATDTPAELVLDALTSARDLAADWEYGRLQEDFEIELPSYWTLDLAEPVLPLVSIVRLAPPSRQVQVQLSKHGGFVADTDAELNAWIRNLRGPQAREPLQTAPALFVWMRRAPRPDQYPRTGADLQRLLNSLSEDGLSAARGVLTLDRGNGTVVLGAKTQAGCVVCAVGLVRRRSNVRGFRRGRVPAEVVLREFFSTETAALRFPVMRADRAWVHGRDQDPLLSSLTDKRVAVVGCGALGAGVARLLAQSGVGHLLLVDPEPLDWPNTSRHVLGGSKVPSLKAPVLASQLKADLPPIPEVEAVGLSWQAVYPEQAELFRRSDLVIMTTGDWASDAAMDDLQASDPEFPDIIFGWLERHAAAGHAVHIARSGCRLRAGFTASGQLLVQAAAWSDDPAPRYCAAAHVPFGAVELAHVQALVARFALDRLLRRTDAYSCRVWLGSRSLIVEGGGDWSKEWKQAFGDPGKGERMYAFAWPPPQPSGP